MGSSRRCSTISRTAPTSAVPSPNARSAALVRSFSAVPSSNRETWMNGRVPGPPHPASRRYLGMPKQTGSQGPGLSLQQRQDVDRVVLDLLPVPAAAARHDAVAGDDRDEVDRADDRESVVGERRRHRVVVGVEPDQGGRVGMALLTSRGSEIRAQAASLSVASARSPALWWRSTGVLPLRARR
jgi:hypothetical protein